MVYRVLLVVSCGVQSFTSSISQYTSMINICTVCRNTYMHHKLHITQVNRFAGCYVFYNNAGLTPIEMEVACLTGLHEHPKGTVKTRSFN